MVTLTDGVIAIALTLLVLDLTSIEVHGSSARELWHTLNQQSSRFVAFFIAFWVIAQYWLLHHRVFRRISRHEDTLAMRNFWFLFGISVLPFTTILLGRTTENPLAVTLFSASLLLDQFDPGRAGTDSRASRRRRTGVSRAPAADDSSPRHHHGDADRGNRRPGVGDPAWPR